MDLSICGNCGLETYYGRKVDRPGAYGGPDPTYDPVADEPMDRHTVDGEAVCTKVMMATPRPEIVCLCGSTRFVDIFISEQKRLTLEGKIVLSVGLFGHEDPDVDIGTNDQPTEVKLMLDELHKRKIDLCDTVRVLNLSSYVGESTRSEVEYALAMGKQISFLEPQSEFV